MVGKSALNGFNFVLREAYDLSGFDTRRAMAPLGADHPAALLDAADGRRVDADALAPLAPGSRLAVRRGAVLGG